MACHVDINHLGCFNRMENLPSPLPKNIFGRVFGKSGFLLCFYLDYLPESLRFEKHALQKTGRSSLGLNGTSHC